jgi:hypothetical protein
MDFLWVLLCVLDDRQEDVRLGARGVFLHHQPDGCF